MGEALAWSGAELITNDRPSGATMYCCRLLSWIVPVMFVPDNQSGVPASNLVPF